MKQITELLSDKVNHEATEMMQSFTKTTKEVLETKFYIPELDYSKVLEIATEKEIPLSLRGDGVQAKLIPELLNEVCRNRNADYVIWGFEEPENSFEYGNAQQLAENFLNDYSKKNQIFITSHAFNFITLEGVNVATFRVWRPDYEAGTQVTCINTEQRGLSENNAELLDEELGIYSLNQELEKIYNQKSKELLELSARRKELEKNSKPVLYVEDEYDEIYKIAWLKLKDISFNENNLSNVFERRCCFRILSANGANNLQGFLQAQNHQLWSHLKIVGLLDFDQKGVEVFHAVKRNWNINKSQFKSFQETGHHIIHPKNQNLKCMLLPVPKRLSDFASLEYPASYIAVEQLLEPTFLSGLRYVQAKKIVGSLEIMEVKSDKKSEFWRQLIQADKVVFKDFENLFNELECFFNNNLNQLDSSLES